MAIGEYRKTLRQFDDYLEAKGGHLGKPQILVEFYRFLLKEFDSPKWKFVFVRHLPSANKILKWAEGDLEQAEGLVFDFWQYYRRKKLNWTLDTVYARIPKYEDKAIHHEHDTIHPDSDESWGLLEADSRARCRFDAEDSNDEERLEELIREERKKFYDSLGKD